MDPEKVEALRTRYVDPIFAGLVAIWRRAPLELRRTLLFVAGEPETVQHIFPEASCQEGSVVVTRREDAIKLLGDMAPEAMIEVLRQPASDETFLILLVCEEGADLSEYSEGPRLSAPGGST